MSVSNNGLIGTEGFVVYSRRGREIETILGFFPSIEQMVLFLEKFIDYGCCWNNLCDYIIAKEKIKELKLYRRNEPQENFKVFEMDDCDYSICFDYVFPIDISDCE